jgi:quercetin dioxygenase-like cupin family protein
MAPSQHPPESELFEQLRREGLRPARWSNGPDAVYGLHDHLYGKVVVVESGSITFTLEPGKRVVAMKRGDRLEVPPRTPHSAVVGSEGVVCLEAHIRPKRQR